MNKKTYISSFLWKLLERFGAQSIAFLISVILARILEPEYYGIVAFATIIISILEIFTDSGLGVALVQKKEVDDLDFSSVFFFNIVMSLLLYFGLFVISPIIARFYRMNDLERVIKVLGLLILISGFKSIQNSYVSRNLLFKKYFFATITGTIVSAIVGIYMAYAGYGVWALVFQNLSNNFIDTLILWITIKWRPKFIFSFSRVKELFSFSWKILISSLIDLLWKKMNELIIGKKYTAINLAYYNKGNHFPEITSYSLISSIDSVVFPVMSKEQDNVDKVKNLTRKSIKIGSYILWPMMIGLAACSDNLIKLLLTEKWMPAVPYLKIFCVTYAFYPIHAFNLNAIKALGRSDIFLKLEIIKKLVGLIIIIIAVRYGVFVMALSTIISNIISQLINTYPNKKLMNYKYIEQLKDLGPSIFLSLFMSVVVYCVNYFRLNTVLTLVLQILIGIIIYIGLSIITKNDSFMYCVEAIKALLNRKYSTDEN